MSGIIANTLKQEAPFASPEHEVVLGLLAAAARIEEPFAAFLKAKAQLTASQYNVLRILRGARPARLTCGDIAARMIDRDPDITRLLDRLEGRELVSRNRGQEDRRVIEVGITSSGLRLMSSLDVHAEQMPIALLGHLGPVKLRQLTTLLEAVISGLGTFP